MGGPTFERSAGPDVRIEAVYPADGKGVECIGAEEDCGVPTDATLRIRVDRYLDARSLPGSIEVYSGDAATAGRVGLEAVYDVVERVVSFRLRGGARFRGHALYTVEFPRAETAVDVGLRAFDGAPLAADQPALRLNFYTSAQADGVEPSVPAPTCAEVVQMFAARPEGAGCAARACHQASAADPLNRAAMGLWLDDAAAFERTAWNRVARETELGDRAGSALPGPARFGIAMPLVDPNTPANSYLMYKLLLQPRNFVGCGASAFCDEGDPCRSAYASLTPAQGCFEPTPGEAERLRAWFVSGDAMPPDDSAESGLGVGGLRALQAFIALGRHDCGD